MQSPDSTETRQAGTGALAGLKVVEFAHVIAGPLAEVADQIVEVRAEARRRKGWIMDTYLLRRNRTQT